MVKPSLLKVSQVLHLSFIVMLNHQYCWVACDITAAIGKKRLVGKKEYYISCYCTYQPTWSPCLCPLSLRGLIAYYIFFYAYIIDVLYVSLSKLVPNTNPNSRRNKRHT